MKKFFGILLVALASISSSCTKVDPAPVYLEVNQSNIAGDWALVSWNGVDLNAGTYLNLSLVRNDSSFRLLTNIDSFPGGSGHELTGKFNLKRDLEDNVIIWGQYDHDSGFWNEYIISELTADSMKWTSVSDPDFVQVFNRVK